MYLISLGHQGMTVIGMKHFPFAKFFHLEAFGDINTLFLI